MQVTSWTQPAPKSTRTGLACGRWREGVTEADRLLACGLLQIEERIAVAHVRDGEVVQVIAVPVEQDLDRPVQVAEGRRKGMRSARHSGELDRHSVTSRSTAWAAVSAAPDSTSAATAAATAPARSWSRSARLSRSCWFSSARRVTCCGRRPRR